MCVQLSKTRETVRLPHVIWISSLLPLAPTCFRRPATTTYDWPATAAAAVSLLLKAAAAATAIARRPCVHNECGSIFLYFYSDGNLVVETSVMHKGVHDDRRVFQCGIVLHKAVA